MKFGRKVFAFGGVVLMFGGVLPVQSAYAYGNQWRPAQAGMVGVGPQAARIANFRPTSRRAIPVNHGRSQYRPTAPTRVRHMAAPLPRQAHQRAYPQTRSAYAPQSAAWTQPFGMMNRVWQQPMTLYGPQFASRPYPAQPWAAYRAPVRPFAAAQRTRGAITPTRRVGQPGRFVQSPPHWQNWRPTASRPGAIAYAPRVAASVPAYRSHFVPRHNRNAALAPAWRPAANRVVASRNLTSGSGTVAAWQSRPETRAWQTQASFRPSTYRKVAQRAEPSAARFRLAERSSQATHLPGWASTYDDRNSGCSWCSGS